MAKKRKQGINDSAKISQKMQQRFLKQKTNQEDGKKIEENENNETEDNFEAQEKDMHDNKETDDAVEELEEEEEEEEDEEGSNQEDDELKHDETQSNVNPSFSLPEPTGKQFTLDEDDDPIEKLLEPFGREQLLVLLKEAADKHTDVADRIRMIADQDPVHRKIFVHGLGWDTTAETLINAFKIYGEIEDCKAVSDKVSGKSKGYGFILFKTRSGARKALKEPQKKIGNRMTACQLASIGPVPPQGSAQPSFPVQQVPEYTQRKIYVSNVGADLEPQKLTAFFSRYGEIEEGPLGLDKVTKKPKGFCLFVYKTVESARKALEEPHKNFEGHILHCQKAIDGPKAGYAPKQLRSSQGSIQSSQYQHGAGVSGGPGHLMAPAARPAPVYNPVGAATPALNPAIGQALTALLANPGAGLGLSNILGSIGSVNQSVPSTYGNIANMNQGVVGSYGSQPGIHSGYQNQSAGQGGAGRGQHGLPQYGGSAPYMGN